MRDYYARFRQELGSDLFKFSKEQVGVNLIAFIVGALVESRVGILDGALVWRSILAGLVAWGAVFLLRAIWGIIKAPVKLDEARSHELAGKFREIQDRDARIVDLEEQLQRKHPHDDHLEQTVREHLNKLEPHEIDCVRCLLDNRKVNRAELRIAGFSSEVPDRVRGKTGSSLIAFESYRPGNGIVEMDRFYSINDQVRQTLKNVLYLPTHL